MNFNFLKRKKTIKIFDKQLYEGDCVNICGLPYVGKTSFCFYIVKQNANKKIFYIAPGGFSTNYKKRLISFSDNILFSESNSLEHINIFLETLPVELVILDTITALQYIDNKKLIENFFTIIHKKKISAIIVSNLVNYNGKETFEHNKILKFFSYVINVEKNDCEIVLNKKYKIKFDEIWK